ncbi:MAG: hypothetical protein MK207_10215 [Saprospiraceae bacterium]|nr:hypothetical protein [Saprospiraceae bacterium]
MSFQIISACKSLVKMLPEGPALTTKQRQQILSKPPYNIKYTGPPKVDFPILPIQVWAATYELDIILVSNNKDWNMHEFAKLETLEGDLWIMKDAEEGSLDQSIVADLQNIHSWLPELPIIRKYFPVKVIDNSTQKMLDFNFSYENIKNEKVEASYFGKYPRTALKKKNGSTMGHSRNQLLAALDLPFRDFGKKASISYNGNRAKINKLLGLVPFQMALKQTQGGVSKGKFVILKENKNILTKHLTKVEPVVQEWSVIQENNKTIVTQKNAFRSLVYEFNGVETLELKVAYVKQWNKDKKGIRIEFSPAIPDLRRPFDGKIISNFVIDVAGKNNNAMGTVTALWENNQAHLFVNPSKPWWVTDRPMKTIIKYLDQQAEISIEMLPDPHQFMK